MARDNVIPDDQQQKTNNYNMGRRAVVVSCVFPPEPVVSAQTSAQIASALRANGHTVRVVTNFPNRPAGKLFPGVRRKFAQRESTPDGIEIVRCFSTLSPESTIRSRMMENLSFGLTSGWQVLTGKKPDVIYANTWPIVATGILFLIAWLRRIPIVLSVQDVYPEVLIVQRRTTENSLLARLMRWVDGVIARRSAHVIVISKGFAEIYRQQRRVPPDLLSLIPNWIDGNQIDISIDGSAYRQALGIDETDFLLVYGGNVGVAAGVEVVIEALQLLAGESTPRLIIAGAGSQLAMCQQLAAKLSGNPVHFHTPWLVSETTEVLRSADLLVLPTRREQSLASAPSKLLSYMLAGRPILAAAVPDSDLAELITRAECGWVVEPDRPDLWAEQIKKIMQLNRFELQRRGNNGRNYVLQHYAKDACLPLVTELLQKAASQNVPCAPLFSMTPTIICREMTPDDIPTVVKVHIESFTGFFLTFLGPAFLHELYSAILADQDGISFVASGENGVVGFVAGTAQPAGFYRRLLQQRWWRFAVASAMPVLKRPAIVPRLLRAFSMPKQVTHQAKRGTLMSIAVLPGCQGAGVGRALVLAFLDAAAQRGLHQVDLTTDQDNNTAANRFYQNMGFVRTQTYLTPEGRAMNEYVIDLSSLPAQIA